MLNFKDMRISKKLLLGFGLLVLLAGSISAVSYYSLQKIRSTNEISVKIDELHHHLLHMFKNGEIALLKETQVHNENAVKAGAHKELEEQSTHYKSILAIFESLSESAILSEKEISDQLQLLKAHLTDYQQHFTQMIASVHKNQGALSQEDSNNNIIKSQRLDNEFDSFIDSVKKPIEVTYKRAVEIEVTLISLTLIIGAVLTWLLTRAIATPIKKLSQAANQFGKGDLSVNFDVYSKDEVGQLAQTFRNLIGATRNLSDAAVKIGSGSFDAEIHPRSEKDVLGQSLLKMRDNLQQLETENKRELWIKTQISKITNTSQGIRDIQILLQTVINELCVILGAGQGLFYLISDEDKPESERQLVLFGSYAYVKRKNLSNRFKMGESLVGQCALEKKSILLTHVPPDYIQIGSGLGEQKPLTILVTPILHENRVLGAIELASFKTFTQAQQDLLDGVTKSLGIIINNVLSNQKTEELLKGSQTLTEELQAQQEELRTTNEELEEKTRILKLSEEKLKVQSEELQTANEELEEKTERLTKQNLSIEEQNKTIEKARADLERRAKDLAMSSKYKSEFLANMSHELRTPLNSLLILSKNLQENKDGNLTEKQMEAARVIYSGGKDLLNLINDILDLSKVEAGHMKLTIDQVIIKQLCDGIKSQFDPIAKDKNIAFHVAINSDVPAKIKSDEQRLMQILKNLLSNAFKFTSQGYVTLKVELPDVNARFKTTGLNAKNTIAWSIVDTGIGIPRDKQEAIFEAFQQADGSTSRNYGGTGLGLAISRALAELLGGEISLISEENKGSTFTLYVPMELPDSMSADSNAKSVTQKIKAFSQKENEPKLINSSGKAQDEIPFLPDDRAKLPSVSRSLLVIEDDKTFSNIVMEVAREKGYLCIAAGDGQTGFSLAKTYQPTGIILDLGLPDVDGLQVLAQLKYDLKTRHIPVHVVSARDETPDIRQKGAVGFISKPVDPDALSSAFNKIASIANDEIRHVLIVEDDPKGQQAIISLIDNPHVKIECAATASEAKEHIMSKSYDCIILDLNLPDKSGFELLQTLNKEKVELPPIVIYTGRELTEEEHNMLQRYASSIIVKGADSPERLLDELSLFLHSIESDLPEVQKQTIQRLHSQNNNGAHKRILLVDDDMRNAFALSSVLEERGLDVLIASNGKTALEKLEEDKDISIVLMDIMMPVMDGYEAMKKIRENQKYKNLPIVALTAKAMADDREKCIQAGANDYIAKPIDTDQLFSVMEVWMSK